MGKMRVNEFKAGKMAEALALSFRRRVHLRLDSIPLNILDLPPVVIPLLKSFPLSY